MIEAQWYLRRMNRRLGIASISAILLSLVALTIFFAGIQPMQKHVDDLRKKMNEHPLQPVAPSPQISPEQALVADLEKFKERFSNVDALSDQLDSIFDLADEYQLQVDKGEYTLVERAGGSLRRFEVTLPVHGSYPHVRDFAIKVLDELPAAALSDLLLEREKISDGAVKATIRFVIFVRKQDPNGAH